MVWYRIIYHENNFFLRRPSHSIGKTKVFHVGDSLKLAWDFKIINSSELARYKFIHGVDSWVVGSESMWRKIIWCYPFFNPKKINWKKTSKWMKEKKKKNFYFNNSLIPTCKGVKTSILLFVFYLALQTI